MVWNRMVRRMVAVVFAAGLAAGALTAASSAQTATGLRGKAKPPVTILFVGGTTGYCSLSTGEQLAGMKAGLRYVNTHGGFGGRKGKLTVVDSNCDPQTAVTQTLKYLSSNPKPDFTWAGAEGTEIAAMIPLMAKEQLLSMAVNDGSQQCAHNASTNCPTYFAIGGPTAVYGVIAAHWLKAHGYKKIGILEEGITFTESETPGLTTELGKLGIPYTKVTFPPTAVDVTAQMSQLKAAGADAIVSEVYGPSAGYTLTARAKLGWNAPVLFDAAASSFDVSKLVPDPSMLKGAYQNIAAPTNGCLKLASVTAMRKAAKAAHVTIGKNGPLFVASYGWDSMLLYQRAVTLAKSTNPIKVANVLTHLKGAQRTNPLYALTQKYFYTTDTHEQQGIGPKSFTPTLAGPIVDGQLHPGCKA